LRTYQSFSIWSLSSAVRAEVSAIDPGLDARYQSRAISNSPLSRCRYQDTVITA
jgi:hypothetical protein